VLVYIKNTSLYYNLISWSSPIIFIIVFTTPLVIFGINGGYNILSISDTGGYPTSISRMDAALNGTPYILPFGYNTPYIYFQAPLPTLPNKLI